MASVWLNRLKTLGNQEFKHDEHWPLKHFETMSHCSFPKKAEEKEPTNMGNNKYDCCCSIWSICSICISVFWVIGGRIWALNHP